MFEPHRTYCGGAGFFSSSPSTCTSRPNTVSARKAEKERDSGFLWVKISSFQPHCRRLAVLSSSFNFGRQLMSEPSLAGRRRPARRGGTTQTCLRRTAQKHAPTGNRRWAGIIQVPSVPSCARGVPVLRADMASGNAHMGGWEAGNRAGLAINASWPRHPYS